MVATMNTEQKAKRYDEAVKKFKPIYDLAKKQGRTIDVEEFGNIFPELKESEDERIRKAITALIEFALEDKSAIAPGFNETKEEALDWLEKQGNTNETINRDEFAQGVLRGAAINLITWIDYNVAKGNMCLSNMECKDIEDALVSGDWDKIYAYMKKKLENQGEQKPANVEEVNYFADFRNSDVEVDSNEDGLIAETIRYKKEKQGEQKPADKVESKFHVNEWVVTDKNDVVQIKAVNNGYYTIDNGMDFNMPYVDRYWHKWTIQDAKDGDVLVNQNGEMPFIFKECKDNHAYCYCGYTNRKDIFFDRFVNIEGEELHWLNLYYEQAYPATKEQRDLLFQKMKEAGYEWDAEKKELKKI